MNDPGHTFSSVQEITPPQAEFNADPDYSDEALKAKYQGTLVMSVVVNPTGEPTDLQVNRPLGLGLEERAAEAVSRWKLKPALKEGKPVAVKINVEVGSVSTGFSDRYRFPIAYRIEVAQGRQ